MKLRYSLESGKADLNTDHVIGRGGEATVYTVRGRKNVAAKIYNRPDAAREDKLRLMIASPPVDPSSVAGHSSIAWPQDLLIDESGRVSGYIMPIVRDAHPLAAIYHPATRRRQISAALSYDYLLRIAFNLCSAIAAIHQLGYVVGDLNDCNILVRSDSLVTVIDCDSFQIAQYRCQVGRPEYMAPELQGQDLSSVARKVDEDCFALAVLIYQLLMGGVHPYAGLGEPPELTERIKAGLTPHIESGPTPPRGAAQLDWLPQALQDLVKASFIEGHAHPSRRPRPRDWSRGLADAENASVKCRRGPDHPFFSHWKVCPACEQLESRRRARSRGNPAGAQRPLVNRATKALPLRYALAVALLGAALLYSVPALKPELDPIFESVLTAGREVAANLSLKRGQRGSQIYAGATGNSVEPPTHELPVVGNDSKQQSPRKTREQDEELATGSEIYRSYTGKDLTERLRWLEKRCISVIRECRLPKAKDQY